MCYSLWYNAPTMLPASGRQHRRCIIPQTVTHSLVLLKMGKIISRNMLSWLELLISRYCCIKKISDNEIYLLIKYIKSVLWRVAKCLSYIEEARCVKVNIHYIIPETLQKLRTYLPKKCLMFFMLTSLTLLYGFNFVLVCNLECAFDILNGTKIHSYAGICR